MTIKPRRPWLATLLSLITPGLGHLYLGKLRLALLTTIIGSIVTVTLIVLLPRSPILLFFLIVTALVYLIGSALHAYMLATKIGDFNLRPYNKWYVYFGYLILFNLSLNWAIPSNQTFKISSISMSPTLLQGDRIVVDVNIYKTSKPNIGDVSIFTRPDDLSTSENESENKFVKRIIGLPGDIIESDGKSIRLNSKILEEPYVDWGVDAYVIQPIKVPDNKLYVIGDNRSHSKDSRFWKDPFIDMKSLVGKVNYIYWSSAGMSRIGMPVK